MKSFDTFLQDALALPFRDSNWATKFAIGMVLIFANSIVPVLPGIFFLGYLYRIQRRVVIENGDPVLPEWDDWGKLFTDGLKYLGAMLVYMLPAILLFGGGYVIIFGGSMIVPLIIMINEDSAAFMALLMMLATFAGIAIMIFGFLISFVIGVIAPAGLVHMCVKDDFAAAFQAKEWSKILRANLGGYVVALLVLSGLSLITTFVFQFVYLTIILCCLLPLIIGALYYYLGTVSANIFAHAYAIGQVKIDLPALEETIDNEAR